MVIGVAEGVSTTNCSQESGFAKGSVKKQRLEEMLDAVLAQLQRNNQDTFNCMRRNSQMQRNLVGLQAQKVAQTHRQFGRNLAHCLGGAVGIGAGMIGGGAAAYGMKPLQEAASAAAGASNGFGSFAQMLTSSRDATLAVNQTHLQQAQRDLEQLTQNKNAQNQFRETLERIGERVWQSAESTFNTLARAGG